MKKNLTKLFVLFLTLFSIQANALNEESDFLGNCGLEIEIINEGCGLFVFEAFNFPENANIYWVIGTETIEEPTHIITYQFEEEWTPNICAFYETPECPEGVEECFNVEVNLCEEDCPNIEVEIINEGCGLYVFETFGFPENAEIFWQIGEEYLELLSPVLTYQFEEEGIHNICAGYETPECPEGVFECFSVEVDLCENDCPTLNDIYAESAEGNCYYWVFEIGSFVEGEEVVWDFGDGNIELGGHFITHMYEESGIYEVQIDYTSSDCPDGVILEFSIEIDCNPGCGLEVEVDNQGCGLFIFEAFNFPENADIYWQIGSEYIEGTTPVLTYQFEEEWTPNICAFYETPECPEGVFECFSVEVNLCEEDCPTLNDFYAGTFEGSCMHWQFEIGSFSEGEEVIWNYGDGTEEVGGHYTDHEYEETGVYIVTAEYFSNACPEGVTLIYTIVVDCCEIVVYYEQVDCNTFGFWADTPDFDPVDWTVDGIYMGSDFFLDLDFEEAGFHEVCVYYPPNENCLDGYEYCQNVFVDVDCYEGCPSEFWAGQSEDDCYLWGFEIGSFQEGEAVTWNFGDGTIVEGGHFIQHNYEEGGVYEIIAYYTSNTCEYAEFSYTILIDCEDDCPDNSDFYAGTFEGSCLHWQFEIGSFSEGEEVIWNYGDGTEETGGHYTDHEYSEPGIYVITAEYFSDACPEGVTLVYTIEVEECETECTLEIDAFVETCEIHCFNGYLFNDDEESIEWSVDGIFMGIGNDICVEFEFEGWHEVCAFYEGKGNEECPEGINECIEVYVDFDCEDDCYIEVEVEELTCEYYHFTGYLSNEDDWIQWYLDDEYLSVGIDAYIGFATEGWHTVCAYYEPTDDCPNGVEWCEEFYISYDDCNCTEVGFAIDSDIEEGGPVAIGWYLENSESGELAESGVCQYNSEDAYCDMSICLPDGCYEMTLWALDFDWDPSWDGIFSAPFIGGDQLDIFNLEVGEGFVSYNFSINSECDEEEDDCELELYFEEYDNGSFEFWVDANSEIISWDFGDGNIIEAGGTGMGYEYTEPGTYVVCAYYSNESCPDGVEDCVTVIVEEDECNELTISITADVDEFDLELIQWYLESEGFGIEGEFPLSSISGEIEFTYCVPDGCYELGLFPTDGLFDLIDLEINVTLDGDLILTEDDFVGGEGETLELAVNSDCTDNIIAFEPEIGFEIYPNPANGVLTIEMTNPAQAQIQIIDASGRLVLSQMVNSKLETLDLSSIASGMYQVNLISNTEIKTKKLIVNK